MANENRQKQNDELLVLQAIYEDDVEDLRLRQAWKVWRPVELLVHLRPASSASVRPSDVYVSVDLHVTCSLDYPNRPPKIELKNEKGLSKKDVAALQTMLTAKAEELKNQEMMLELCQIVQTFLYEKNAPPEYVSFHEGMEKRRARQMQQQKTEEQLLRDSSTKREAEEIEAELMRRQDEQRLRKNESELRKRSSSEIPERTTQRMRSYTEGESGTSTPLSDSIRVPIVFADGVEHGIQRSSLPARFRSQPHRFCIEWSGIDELTGAAVFVSEWSFECQLGKKTNRKASSMDEFVNMLGAIEKEAQPLFKLSKHPNVCRYLALDSSRRFVTGKGFVQKIYVVRSMDEDEQALSRAIESRVKLPAEALSKIAKYILNALNFLHAKDILHKYILPDCIWEVPEKGYTLSDYYLRYRLLDLADCFCVCAQLPKEERALIAGSGKSSRRSDIYCFGAVLTALANGEWSVRGDLLPQVPPMADQALVDFLNHCFGLNADGWTASRLLEHNFILYGPAQRQNALVDSLATTAAATDEELPFDDISVGGQSRLGQEFSLLKHLGKGGFGDVIMVRNKLDGNVYAIKRIPLNPRSKMLNKKIIREAKLFSRLNHENVVRYFNSWIEAISKPTDQGNESIVAQLQKENYSEVFLRSNLRDLEANAPAVGETSVEWSTSVLKESTSTSSSSSSDSDLDSTDASNPVGVFAPSFYEHRSSDSSDAEVIFEDTSAESVHDISDVNSSVRPENDKEEGAEAAEETTSRVLYIQMEFCERSTLRRAIDAELLSSNPRRVWRLFREMLEGLKYIHGQGMIHRDIKPVNIFLDGQDHVKIGDFGLATQDLPLVETPTACASLDESAVSHGLTTDIGTALYVAPELTIPRKSGDKTPTYTNRVDIFSVGIVLFEMFYRPLEPGMERYKTLNNIRNGPHFPDDFGLSLPINTRETAKNVISRTLTIDSTKRPTAEELLASEEIPVVEMRDTEFQMVFKAISDKQSRTFRLIMDSLFSRFPTSTLDYCFDQNIYKDASLVEKALRMNRLERKFAEIFRIHGAVPLVTPLVTPASMLARTLFASRQQLIPYLLMDKSGLVVSLPYDLRYGFARLAARNEINPLKRYVFGKAYRSGNQGEHPKEAAECAVDFLTAATGAATSTAEMLFILHQIGLELVGVHHRRCSLRLGHMKLVKAALLHIGVADDNEQIRVIQALPDALAGNADAQKFANETALPLTAATTLYDVLKKEGPLDRITAELRVLTRTKNETVARLTKEALNDLEKIKNALDILLACDKDVDVIPLTVAVGLVHRPDVYIDGVVFTASVEMAHKKRKVDFVFAVGGRYDTLVKTIRQGHLDKEPTVPFCAIGCSIWMDLLADIDGSVGGDASCSVLVCSQSGAALVREKLAFVRQLWTAGIAADFLHEPVDEREDIVEYCTKKGIAYLATMLDADSVLLKTIDGERDREIKYSREVAVDVVRGEAKPTSADSVGGTSLVASTSSIKANVGDAVYTGHSPSAAATAAATFANVKIRYVMLERPQANTRKRIEVQIWAVLSSTMSKYSAKTTIEVLATELPLSVIRAITGVVDQKSTAVELTASIADVIKRFNKYKREVNIVFDELRSILLDGDRSVFAHKVIILYGKEPQAEEGFCRVIL